MEFFTHPWYMAAGGALISSPILIHLINRMRFKRIRWAAMEFLLKSQKRNRRRLIIEQMILLLLRILLVLLAAFLLARFLYSGAPSRGAAHVVVIDDTLSMLDKGKEGQRESTAFETAIEQIKELAKNASQAPSPQQIEVHLLSELARPLDPAETAKGLSDRQQYRSRAVYAGRLSNASANEINTKFNDRGRRPTLLHHRPLVALQVGRVLLADQQEVDNRIIHLVSDFRDSDWAQSADADKLTDEIKEILKDGVNLNLIDVASPYRAANSRITQHHDNLALTDLKAETRVATEDTEVEFTASLMNYGLAEAATFLQVFINGEEDLGRSQNLTNIPPGRELQHKFTLRFQRKPRPNALITDKDTDVEVRERKRRLDREFFHIRVRIRPEPSGLNVDNIRDMVIEVRKKVPTLVVDGNRPEGRGDGGDLHHLRAYYEASGIYEIEPRSLAELLKTDLELYPSVILLNVGEMEPALVAKLKTYVENGGSLAYFLGEEVKADHYNNVLFKAGIFPLLISDNPYDPLAAVLRDPVDRQRERDRLRQLDPQPKILFPRPDHIIAARLAPWASGFRYLSVNVYWQALSRSKWDPDGRHVETPIVLPNTGDARRYQARAMDLVNRAQQMTEKLANTEPEMKRFVEPVKAFPARFRAALSRGELYQLGQQIEALLRDPGVKSNPNRPNMAELWGHVEMKSLADELREFREQVLYGDPLVVTRRVGRGKVVAMLTTAGTSMRKGVGEDSVQWNNWGAGDRLVALSYPLFMIDVHKYLISEGQAPNRVLGEDVRFQLDAARYDRNYTITFDAQPDVAAEGPRLKPEEEKAVLAQSADKKVLDFALTNNTRPGVYRIALTLLGEGAPEDRQEIRSYAYNVSADLEGNLKRATKERLDPDLPSADRGTGRLTLVVPGTSYDTYQEKKPDASDSTWPWLFLFIIIILVVEQAMAVHLSFHTRGDEAAAPANRGQPMAA